MGVDPAGSFTILGGAKIINIINFESKIDELHYEISNDIKAGEYYNIHPSSGYGGIKSGLVEILSIKKDSEVAVAVRESIGQTRRDRFEFWVKYKYRNEKVSSKEWLPLILFIQHTTII